MATESEPEAPATASSRSGGRSGKSKAEPETQAVEQTDVEMPVSQLIENSVTYLGHSRWTAAGALHGHDPDDMLSVESAKAEIEQWRTTPATPPPDSEE